MIGPLVALLLGAAPVVPAPDWDQDSTRWFAAARFDAGLMLKATGQLGYGQPFWIWAGLQASTTVTMDFAAVAAGLRLSLPVIEFTAEYRRTEPFQRGDLDARASYDSDHLDASERRGYDALDLDLWGVAPFPYGYVFGECIGTWLPDAAPRYDELMRAVVRGWTWAARGAVGARLGEGGWLRFGGIVEAEWSERDVQALVRVGPSVQLVFGRHADLVVAALWPVQDADTLHFTDAMTGALALRWRIATGDDAPIAFP